MDSFDTLRRRTVIDGSAAGAGEAARQVVVAAGNTTLDGLEIRGGDSGFRSAIGGGIIVERLSNVRIAGCTITENSGVYGAGLRDKRLLGNPIGAAFTDAYYRLSPPIARTLATRDALRAATRKWLAPLVDIAQHLNKLN